MTNTDYIRASIYAKCGLDKNGDTFKRSYLPSLESLQQSEWSHEFEMHCRSRLIMGAFRYGLLNKPGKKKFDRIPDMIKRLQDYQVTGNDEILVDVANLAMMVFEEGAHENKHFKSVDDGIHSQEIKQ
jgi:hypothetical protein